MGREYLKGLEGVLHFWSETGTEGGYWAFQDKKFIYPPTPDWPHERWSYDGQHVLRNGDALVIYSKDEPRRTIWSGEIELIQYPMFTESAHGMWIHTDQKGVGRDTWAKWFIEEYPALLVKAEPQ